MTTTIHTVKTDERDAHIEELQRQLAEANTRADAMEAEKFRMIDMMMDKVHAKNIVINQLLDAIGPWHGPLNQFGGRIGNR